MLLLTSLLRVQNWILKALQSLNMYKVGGGGAGSAQGFLNDCLQGLVVWVDGDFMFAAQVVMPFIHAGHDRKTLFLNLSIISFCVSEGV